jgi:hypothetical protein
MSTPTIAGPWITGEEFGEERRRLLDLGYGSDSPEYRALLRRVGERINHLWQSYAVPLLGQHPGKWVAISLGGEVLLAEKELDAMKLGRARFGPGNFLVARLDQARGERTLGPRE